MSAEPLATVPLRGVDQINSPQPSFPIVFSRPEMGGNESHPEYDKLCATLGDACCGARQAELFSKVAIANISPPVWEVYEESAEGGWCGRRFYKVKKVSKTGGGSNQISVGEDGGFRRLDWSGSVEIIKTKNIDGTYLATYSGNYFQSETTGEYNPETEEIDETTTTTHDLTLSGSCDSLDDPEPQWEGTIGDAPSFVDDPDRILGLRDVGTGNAIGQYDWEYEDPVTFQDWRDSALENLPAGEWSSTVNFGPLLVRGGIFNASAKLKAFWTRKWINEYGSEIRFHYRIAKREALGECGVPLSFLSDTWEWLIEDTSEVVEVEEDDLEAETEEITLPEPSEWLTATEETAQTTIYVTGPSYILTPTLRLRTTTISRCKRAFRGYDGTGLFSAESISGDAEAEHLAEPSNFISVAQSLTAQGEAGNAALLWLSPTVGNTQVAGSYQLFPNRRKAQDITQTSQTIKGGGWEVNFTLSGEIDPVVLADEVEQLLEDEFDPEGLHSSQFHPGVMACNLPGAGGLCRWRAKSTFYFDVPRPNIDGPFAESEVTVRWKIWTLNYATGERTFEEDSEILSWEQDAINELINPNGAVPYYSPGEPEVKSTSKQTLDAAEGEIKWVEALPLDEAMHVYPGPVWEVVDPA